MKKRFFILLVFLSTTTLFAQHKEWQKLVHLLQKEAGYFSGKSGFIRLMKSEYNIFEIKAFSVNDSLFVSEMLLADRFENTPSERHIKETIVFTYGFEIQSAQVFYDCMYYFEDFPKSQFLLITFDIPHIHQITSVYKNLETKQEDQTTMEDATNQILIPIRAKNRKKILKSIDTYQEKTIKEQLITDRNH